MKIQSETFIIFIHISMILVYAIFIIARRSYIRKEHFVPLCFIPIFGVLLALAIDLINLLDKQGIKKPEVEYQGLDDDILWATLKSVQEKSDLVPLEEAVLINEAKIRRKSMLETLYTDPAKYLDVLNTAKYNDDIEISHYATTTISKAQKDFQLAIQKHEVEVHRHPDDPGAIDAYIAILGKYIQSGLLEEGLLSNLRIVYAKALDRKLAITRDDRNALTEKLRNAVELQDFTCALETAYVLRDYWPEDEQCWIELIRVCVEGKDGKELKKTIGEIQQHKIYWTEQGKEQLSPWIKMGTQ